MFTRRELERSASTDALPWSVLPPGTRVRVSSAPRRLLASSGRVGRGIGLVILDAAKTQNQFARAKVLAPSVSPRSSTSVALATREVRSTVHHAGRCVLFPPYREFLLDRLAPSEFFVASEVLQFHFDWLAGFPVLHVK